VTSVISVTASTRRRGALVLATRLVARSVALVLVLVLADGGCRRSHDAPTADPPATLIVRQESVGLLLTWIDDKGDFHVETSVADVPMMGRDAVRVVDPTHEDTAPTDSVTVVDLRQAGPDGNYPVRTMPRADFEAMAVARREKAGPTLASAGPAPSPPPGGSRAAGAAGDPSKASARSVVVIYGAEWCGACHEAAKYLRSKGIPYVDKDVEKDPGAAAEMQQKLAKNGLHEGSIPVIDVGGKVMVGFNPAEIDAALGQAL
jgi:glutaredoxin